MKAVVGLDFGTQSARAILADTETGRILLRRSVDYPHGVLPGCLADPADYETALFDLLEAVFQSLYRDEVVGIGVDATSFSMVPLDASGRPLSTYDAFSGHPHALVKLWKRHTAQALAEEALKAARDAGQPFLRRTGGSISCEWALPKLLEIYDEAPEVWEHLDAALDLCDYLTYRLTGVFTRSKGSMSYKALWWEDLGFPAPSYLNALRPGLLDRYRSLFRGKVLASGGRAGFLQEEICRRFGVRSPVAVAAGVLDGHTAPVALGALQPGDATLVAGTSNVLAIQTDAPLEIDGICGVARDGFSAGLYGIDSGQASTGDMLDWFVRRALPYEMREEARTRNVSPHALLCERIRRPWQDRIIAVDWFNGSRNAPCDLSLPGAVVGLSLDTEPEDIYLGLMQAIVCGSREILERCASCGVTVKRILATGGVARKNPLLMQLYADVLGRDVFSAEEEEGPALGSAIFAAVAAGVFPSAEDAYAHMGLRRFIRYSPDPDSRAGYENVFQKNHRLRELLIQCETEGEKQP